MKNLTSKIALAAGATAVAGSASAAIDTAALITEIGGAGTAAAAVGIAVLTVIVSIRALKYIRSAL